MAFLNEEIQAQVRPLLEELTNPVEMKVYTGGKVVVPGRDATGHQEETLGLLREVAELSDNVTVTEAPLAGDEEALAAGITRAPTIVFRRQGEDRTNLRFVGLPSGYEFTTVLEALRLVASDDDSDDLVGDLNDPLLLQTFVTPSCPHCPRAVLTAFELALANDKLVAEGIEASEFPVLSQQFRISSVPDTIIGQSANARVLGAQPKRQFVDAIRNAAGVAA
ncbi:MAG: thioredoxin family protein [Trueperaceae bacterium]|nr:thioredoxin family protein [Trueperaceae bacterium]